jgi:hypothetical protein
MARSTAARTAASTLAFGSEVVGGVVDGDVVDLDVEADVEVDDEFEVEVVEVVEAVVLTTPDVRTVELVVSGAASPPELHAARSSAHPRRAPTQRPATTPTPPSTELSRDASGPPTPSVFIATLGEVPRRRKRRHGQRSIRRPPGRIERCRRNANTRKGSPSPSGPSIPHPTRHLQRYAPCQQQPCLSTGCVSEFGGTPTRTGGRSHAHPDVGRGRKRCYRPTGSATLSGMTATAFDQIRSDASGIIERLVDVGIQSRGSMLPPTMDITSPAHQQLKDDGALSSPGFPSPIYGVYGHIERLLIASDDQARCVAHLLAKPEPSWFGHLASIRSTVESLSRVWFLADPAIASVERATRLANEQLYEISHATNMLKDYLTGMPAELYKQAETHLADRRKGLSDWAKAQGVVNPGGFLGAKRPGPSELLAAV